MMSVSVDGYMEGPNREIDWHMVDDELHRHMNGWLAGAGAFLEGRVTYELMEDLRPNAHPDPAAPPPPRTRPRHRRSSSSRRSGGTCPRSSTRAPSSGPPGTRLSSTRSSRPRGSPSRHSPVATSSSAAPPSVGSSP